MILQKKKKTENWSHADRNKNHGKLAIFRSKTC